MRIAFSKRKETPSCGGCLLKDKIPLILRLMDEVEQYVRTDFGAYVGPPKKPPERSRKEPALPMDKQQSIATDFDEPPILALVRAQMDQAMDEYEKLHDLAYKAEVQKVAAWDKLSLWKSVFKIVYEKCYAPDQADQQSS